MCLYIPAEGAKRQLAAVHSVLAKVDAAMLAKLLPLTTTASSVAAFFCVNSHLNWGLLLCVERLIKNQLLVVMTMLEVCLLALMSNKVLKVSLIE